MPMCPPSLVALLHFLEVILVYKFLFLRHQINSSQQRIFKAGVSPFSFVDIVPDNLFGLKRLRVRAFITVRVVA
jgi:hypothetical protein